MRTTPKVLFAKTYITEITYWTVLQFYPFLIGSQKTVVHFTKNTVNLTNSVWILTTVYKAIEVAYNGRKVRHGYYILHVSNNQKHLFMSDDNENRIPILEMIATTKWHL